MPPPSARVHHLIVALGTLVALSVGWSAVGAAAEVESPQRVAMASDLRVFYLNEVGDEATNAGPELVDLQAAMRRGVEEQWRASAAQAQATVLGTERIDEAVVGAPMYEDNLELAREWGQMGVEAYKRVQTQTASEYLERSLRYFETISHDLVAPGEVSEILMYLALSYLEDGTNVVRPLDVLQEMIRRDPGRRLQRGYYPDFIVQYYENARQSLWRQLREDGPPIEESRRIATLTEAEFVFHAYAIPTAAQSVELVAYLYDADDEQLMPPERLMLETVDEATIEEGFSRLASRLSVCLVEPMEIDGDTGPSGGGTGRLSLEIGMSYSSFLQVPTPVEVPFGNYGMTLGLAWSLTPEFRLFGDMRLANSMRDYSGVLADSFTTIGAVLGGELGGGLGPFRIGIGVGLEMMRFGPVEVFTDKRCIPDPDRLCPGGAGRESFRDQSPHWGVRLQPRVGWRLSQTFELSARATAGYYFSPLQEQLFNFPIAAEFGVGYRF